jgi:ribosomal protein L11 methylase PrmA
MDSNENIQSSFRDPSGFLFYHDGLIYRQVNLSYKENYNHLMESGLYQELTEAKLLVRHEDVGLESAKSEDAYKIIKPQLIPFISYPYEWSFSQLKSAAIATLEIQKKALDFEMSLKDCSAYNIQFRKGKPILIDTLSFEKYRQGEPWVAYRQFCQHFLAPLALMSYKDIRLNQLLRIHIDGVPLDLASSLLPFRTRFKFSLLCHIHLHAKSQKHFADKTVSSRGRQISRLSFLGLIDNLESAVNKLTWRAGGTEWADYYKDTNYSSAAFEHKKQIVAEFLEKINPKNVWDLGANDGLFSRMASDKGIETISFDIDPAAVEKNYLQCTQKEEQYLLPLLLDLTNPSSGIGWGNEERLSILKRGPTEAMFALALIHHLAISNNVPLVKIAALFSRMCKWLIIEFVPKSDSQVKKLLSTREDVFGNYKQQIFESQFEKYFTVQACVKIKDSERTLYLMHSREAKL